MQVGRAEKARPLDDPTRPYIRFDIVAHLDGLSSHEGTKRVGALSAMCQIHLGAGGSTVPIGAGSAGTVELAATALLLQCIAQISRCDICAV